jgi:putative tryptophan/tyrosine transport system substrate-binding protein
MQRREFITALAGAAALPLTVRAQQPTMPVVGFLGTGSLQFDAFRVVAVRQSLMESGYVEGRNVAFEYRWAEDHYERLPALAVELARREVSVIVAMGGVSSALAAKSATASIPIVFAIGGDPTKSGIVASLNRPDGNITGTTFLTNVLIEKQFEILHETVPGTALIGFLVNSTNANADTDTRNVLAAAESIGQKVLVVRAHNDSDLEAAFVAMDQGRIGAFLVAADPFFLSRRDKLVELAARRKIPAIYPSSEYTTAGGLMSYGTSISNAFRVVGVYVARILKGERPADLPVQQSTKVELIINLKTAKALGLTVPLPLLGRADEVIE